MPEETGRFSSVVKWARVAAIVSETVLAAAVILCIGAMVDMILRPQVWAGWLGLPESLVPWVCVARCGLSVLGMVVVGLWVWTLQGCVRAWVSAEDAARSAASRLRTLETLLEDQAASAHRLVDLSSLSDRARSLIYRDREVAAFRETVQADLTRQDYAAAVQHIEAIEKAFGSAEEVQRLRKELEDSRKATQDEKIDQAMFRLQRIVEEHDWARAQREAQRIVETFPDNAKVAPLPQRVENARMRTKRDLLQQYGEAVGKNDVEKGVKLLRELDRYLTPQEAAALAESARGVFHAKLVNLQVQFSIQVAEQRWEEALATGEEIIRDFPNTRMSQEVGEKISLLRQRAAAAKQE